MKKITISVSDKDRDDYSTVIIGNVSDEVYNQIITMVMREGGLE